MGAGELVDMLCSAVTCVRVASRFDTDTAADVKLELKPLISKPGHIVLDLRGALLDSTGLGVVVSLKWRLEQDGRRLLVVGDGHSLNRLIERAGVANYLPVYESVEEAMLRASC
jgi:anti-anti-sigma factor